MADIKITQDSLDANPAVVVPEITPVPSTEPQNVPDIKPVEEVPSSTEDIISPDQNSDKPLDLKKFAEKYANGLIEKHKGLDTTPFPKFDAAYKELMENSSLPPVLTKEVENWLLAKAADAGVVAAADYFDVVLRSDGGLTFKENDKQNGLYNGPFLGLTTTEHIKQTLGVPIDPLVSTRILNAFMDGVEQFKGLLAMAYSSRLKAEQQNLMPQQSIYPTIVVPEGDSEQPQENGQYGKHNGRQNYFKDYERFKRWFENDKNPPRSTNDDGKGRNLVVPPSPNQGLKNNFPSGSPRPRGGNSFKP
jgi:hypothetical protein